MWSVPDFNTLPPPDSGPVSLGLLQRGTGAYVYMCIQVCMHVYMYLCMHVCIYVYMCVCIYIYVYIFIRTDSGPVSLSLLQRGTGAYVYVCIYV